MRNMPRTIPQPIFSASLEKPPLIGNHFRDSGVNRAIGIAVNDEIQ